MEKINKTIKASKPSEKGFTLIEVIISLIILLVLSAFIGKSIMITSKARSLATTKTYLSIDMQTTSLLLKKSIRDARYRSIDIDQLSIKEPVSSRIRYELVSKPGIENCFFQENGKLIFQEWQIPSNKLIGERVLTNDLIKAVFSMKIIEDETYRFVLTDITLGREDKLLKSFITTESFSDHIKIKND